MAPSISLSANCTPPFVLQGDCRLSTIERLAANWSGTGYISPVKCRANFAGHIFMAWMMKVFFLSILRTKHIQVAVLRISGNRHMVKKAVVFGHIH